MKHFYTLFILLFISNLSFSQVTELYFSKYGEGSSNNKFLEIYNGTDNDIDLSNYAYPSVANAPSTPGEYEFWNSFDEFMHKFSLRFNWELFNIYFLLTFQNCFSKLMW